MTNARLNFFNITIVFRLRQELKEVLAEKLKPMGVARGGGDNIDKDIINNLEGQINLLKKVFN